METYVVRVYRKNSDQLAGMVEAIDTNQHVPFQGVSGLQIVLEQSIGAFESGSSISQQVESTSSEQPELHAVTKEECCALGKSGLLHFLDAP
jgi:hypothetical protein